MFGRYDLLKLAFHRLEENSKGNKGKDHITPIFCTKQLALNVQ